MAKPKYLNSENFLAPKTLEIEDKAIKPEQAQHSAVRRVRVAGFRGTYRNMHFDVDGYSVGPVHEETLKKLVEQFPVLVVEEV